MEVEVKIQRRNSFNHNWGSYERHNCFNG